MDQRVLDARADVGLPVVDIDGGNARLLLNAPYVVNTTITDADDDSSELKPAATLSNGLYLRTPRRGR